MAPSGATNSLFYDTSGYPSANNFPCYDTSGYPSASSSPCYDTSGYPGATNSLFYDTSGYPSATNSPCYDISGYPSATKSLRGVYLFDQRHKDGSFAIMTSIAVTFFEDISLLCLFFWIIQ